MSLVHVIIVLSKKGEKMRITKHGNHRIKERIGLQKRAHARHVKKVLSFGMLHARKGYEEFKVIYQGFLYIFKLRKKLEPVLVTTYKELNFKLRG